MAPSKVYSVNSGVNDNYAGVSVDSHSATVHSLRLPGKQLFLMPLLKAKKYCNNGNKQGVSDAWEELEQSGLGKLERTDTSKLHGMVCYKQIYMYFSHNLT